MTPEIIEMIGTFIVLPICVAAVLIAFFWAASK